MLQSRVLILGREGQRLTESLQNGSTSDRRNYKFENGSVWDAHKALDELKRNLRDDSRNPVSWMRIRAALLHSTRNSGGTSDRGLTILCKG